MQWRVKIQSFRMCSKLSCYQPKIDCYKLVVVCKSHGNHKAKTHHKYTKDKVKGTKHTTEECHQTTKKESKRRTTILQPVE